MSKLFDELEAEQSLERKRIQFQNLDIKKIKKLSEKELSLEQSKYNPNDPLHIFIQNEWNQRLLKEELKTIRYMTVVTIVTSLLTGLIGFILNDLIRY
jgi:hypothetical protein